MMEILPRITILMKKKKHMMYESYTEQYEGETEYYEYIPDDALTVVYQYYDYVIAGQY
jgi:hypothetical protein